VLEQNGSAVNTPTTMSLALYGQDGGVVHQQTFTNVPVTNGRFRLELGDTQTIDSSVFASNFVEAEVSVGAQRLGRQRILSVPYALHTGDVITQSMMITVGQTGASFTKLEDAWAWLKTKLVVAPVTVKVLNGTYALPAGGIELNHPNGDLISVVGNPTTPTMVTLVAVDHGLLVTHGNRLRSIDGFQLTGASNVSTFAIWARYGSVLNAGPNLRISGFDYGVRSEGHSTVTVLGADVTGIPTGSCYSAYGGAWLELGPFSASSCSIAVEAGQASFVSTGAGTVTNAGYAILASHGSYAISGGMTITGLTGPYAFYSGQGSVIYLPTSDASPYTYSPPVSSGTSLNFAHGGGLILY